METGNPLLLSFTNTLKLYKDLLVTNVGFDEPYKSAVFTSAVLVQMKSQVSKFALVFQQTDDISVCQPFLDQLLQASASITSHSHQIGLTACGKCYAAQVKKSTIVFLDAMLALVRPIAMKGSKEEQDMIHLTFAVVKSLDTLIDLTNKKNKDVILQNAEIIRDQLKDAHGELKDITVREDRSETTEEELSSDSDDIGLSISKDQLPLVPFLVEILRLTELVVSQIVLKILQHLTDDQALDATMEKADALSVSADNLATSIYDNVENVVELFRSHQTLLVDNLHSFEAIIDLPATLYKIIPMVIEKITAQNISDLAPK